MRLLLLLAASSLACGCVNSLDSEREAELAYLGLDAAIKKSVALGFDGFNAASSANIPPQAAAGDVSGTLLIQGQVDQGASVNKGMRLTLAMDEYSDLEDLNPDGQQALSVTYSTDPDAALPALDMQLRDIPDGTFEGTLVGTFLVAGGLEGDVEISVALDGLLESDGAGGTRFEPGSTTIVGLAVSPSGGEFAIDITL